MPKKADVLNYYQGKIEVNTKSFDAFYAKMNHQINAITDLLLEVKHPTLLIASNRFDAPSLELTLAEAAKKVDSTFLTAESLCDCWIAQCTESQECFLQILLQEEIPDIAFAILDPKNQKKYLSPGDRKLMFLTKMLGTEIGLEDMVIVNKVENHLHPRKCRLLATLITEDFFLPKKIVCTTSNAFIIQKWKGRIIKVDDL